MTITIDSRSYVSPNYDARPAGTAIDAIVIHTTEGAWDSDAAWLCNPASQVSAHYVIPPSGSVIYRLVSDAARAWHAGQSSYQGRSNWNNFSIGIEISHKQGQPWASEQQDRTAALCRQLIATYHIPQSSIVAHRWIATPSGRKVDPTDWSDADFTDWIAGLYAPAYTRYQAGPYGAIAQQDRRAGAPTAKHYAPGETFESDDIQQDYAHDRTGIGFVPLGQIVKQ